jgi:hypothetical protein
MLQVVQLMMYGQRVIRQPIVIILQETLVKDAHADISYSILA